jgi:hypothetical protein
LGVKTLGSRFGAYSQRAAFTASLLGKALKILRPRQNATADIDAVLMQNVPDVPQCQR